LSRPAIAMRPRPCDPLALRRAPLPAIGTASLFAALAVKSGQIIGECHRRHRAIEFRKFLDRVEAEVPTGLEVHLILDNYGTHKAPLIRRWLVRHPRVHLHFTPTSASWTNLVERWFATNPCERSAILSSNH
jgi:hypothetical protein